MVLPLSLLAYHACPEEHREWYETHVPETMRHDTSHLRRCCELVMNTMLAHDRQHYERLEDMTRTQRGLWRLRAVRHGHPDCAHFIGLVRNGLPADDPSLCPEAAMFGNINTLRWLHESGFPWDEDTTAAAAHSGVLDCLRYAHENGCRWDFRTIEAAARHADPACLRYAHENGCEWDDMVTCNAAAAGSLACLEYAHSNGCPWHPSTCVAAALSGHVECLMYAAENGSPMDLQVCMAAAESGNDQCIDYSLQWFERGLGIPRENWRYLLEEVRAEHNESPQRGPG